MARLDQTPFEIEIADLAHDGRGVGCLESGKTVLVRGALAGERVLAKRTRRARDFDQAVTLEVLRASPDRVEARCPHFGGCGGCVLQHLDVGKQIEVKQSTLLELMRDAGGLVPEEVLPPLVDSAWGYRRKGRLSVRWVAKKGRTLVGFREPDPRFVADLSECHTVIPEIGGRIGALAELVDGLQARVAIPQIEFIAGDDAVALVVRHLEPLGEGDRQALVSFSRQQGLAVFLQPGGLDTVHPLWPPEPPALALRLAPWDVELGFQPMDFIQVNAALNEKMIGRALELLEAGADDRVLDLFCGLGNFTLPLARTVREVVGVEGEAGLVARARENALRNGLDNAQFHAADLTLDQRDAPWMAQGFDKLLLDPPRSGALEVLRQLPVEQFQRIVYVSCNPVSLARDAEYLVNERGWKLRSAGVMDMFPHTAHVESIAMFEPG
ncbi:MAG: 23S rRNA (uracil(1939)-C(5))-methyltransferase RlmD [Luteimonas sp.]